MKLSIKLINLFCLIGAVVWLARHPDWEPLVTSLGLLGLFLGQEIYPFVNKSYGKDVELANQFLTELPSNSRMMYFLKDKDVGNPIDGKILQDIDSFVVTWDNAEHKFINKKLEKARSEFWSHLKEFKSELAVNIFTNDGSTYRMDIKDGETRKDVLTMHMRLNDMASQAFEKHQTLINAIKKHIG